MKTWFTSDTHLGHTNIIDFCRRPFVKPRKFCDLCDANGERAFHSREQGTTLRPCVHPDVQQHDRVIIERWNERVAPDDLVYHLGDFAFGNFTKIAEYAAKLNGKKVLVRGNHDRLSDGAYQRMGFLVRKRMLLGSVHLQHHPPPYNEAPRGIWLVGHVHERWATNTWKTRPGSLLVNVGVDVRDFRPVTMEDLGLDPNLLV